MKAQHTFFLSVVLVLANNSGYTQELAKELDNRQAASRYVIGKTNELLMPVNILGAVDKSGQYMVPSETDLLALLAFAGGLQEDAKLNDVKIIRRISGQEKPQTIKIDLQKLYETGDDVLPPKLTPDDLVIVGKKKVVTSRAIADIFRTVAFAAQTVYIIYLISKN